MNTKELVAALDAEILRLRQARELLADHPQVRRGRPRGSINKKVSGASTSFNPPEFSQQKRKMATARNVSIVASQQSGGKKEITPADQPAAKPNPLKKATSKAAPTKSQTRKAAARPKVVKAELKSGEPKRKRGRPVKNAGTVGVTKPVNEPTSAAAS